ncbi:hypothetical protein D9619_010059 [Psilocybe cf. subviscida]|uniref:F-box domain-containing protein n=1 Tax=Psilocybe cf. subviscida TaxID=2480587 RepID=A0A8H5BLK6_9AGAR|nr:hypothetical protein D9619_010059 [Psilocybe cf. subviscida]
MPLDVDIPPNRSQRLIDEELFSSEMRALQLKTERNACAEISKLPEDVLGEIFTILANSCPLKSWFRINLVCRHWRETALATVALWTKPPTHHHDLTLLMLERSKMADLHINIGPKTSPTTLTALLSNIGRFHTLYMVEHADFVHAMGVLKSLRRQISRLQQLEIYFLDGFLRETSSASSIALRQFDWEVLPLPNLTHLSLQAILLPSPISVQYLLQTLHDMPNLKSLKLCSDIIAHHHSPLASNHLKGFQLPHLLSFQIRWRVTHHQVIYLLSYLHLPRLSYLNISCISNEDMHADGDSDCSSFMRAALFTVSSGDFSTCDTLVLCSDHWFHLIPRQYSGSFKFLSKGLVINFSDYAGFNASTQHFTLEVVAALNDQILSHLVKLELYDSQPPVDEILRLFGRLPNLECIEIDPSDIVTLIKGLSIPLDHPPRTPLRIFPKLKEITLTYVRRADPQMIQAFCDSLKARYHFGAPIQKLFVDTSSVLESSVLHSLEEIGVEVLDISES